MDAGSTPSAMVAWACGSRSMTSVGLPLRASAAARLTVVVVLPTPPFWFISAIKRTGRDELGTPGMGMAEYMKETEPKLGGRKRKHRLQGVSSRVGAALDGHGCIRMSMQSRMLYAAAKI